MPICTGNPNSAPRQANGESIDANGGPNVAARYTTANGDTDSWAPPAPLLAANSNNKSSVRPFGHHHHGSLGAGSGGANRQNDARDGATGRKRAAPPRGLFGDRANEQKSGSGSPSSPKRARLTTGLEAHETSCAHSGVPSDATGHHLDDAMDAHRDDRARCDRHQPHGKIKVSARRIVTDRLADNTMVVVLCLVVGVMDNLKKRDMGVIDALVQSAIQNQIPPPSGAPLTKPVVAAKTDACAPSLPETCDSLRAARPSQTGDPRTCLTENPSAAPFSDASLASSTMKRSSTPLDVPYDPQNPALDAIQPSRCIDTTTRHRSGDGARSEIRKSTSPPLLSSLFQAGPSTPSLASTCANGKEAPRCDRPQPSTDSKGRPLPSKPSSARPPRKKPTKPLAQPSLTRSATTTTTTTSTSAVQRVAPVDPIVDHAPLRPPVVPERRSGAVPGEKEDEEEKGGESAGKKQRPAQQQQHAWFEDSGVLGPACTYNKYLSIMNTVSALRVREKRELFKMMREGKAARDPHQVVDRHTLLPRLGITFGEFALFYVLTSKTDASP